MNPPRRVHYALFILIFAGAAIHPESAHADVIRVPGDHGTIQAAIDASVDGDEIVVAPGAYNEALDMLGKAVWLHSTGGAELTTIDASGLDASVVKCTSGEGPKTRIEGFTITGGAGTLDNQTRYGGGMYVAAARPTVVDCTLIKNAAHVGAGMANASDAGPTVTGCAFIGNAGDGMSNSSSDPTITDCRFVENLGNGIHNTFSSPTVTDSQFVGNAIRGMWNGYENSSSIVTNCEFRENLGGGMYNDEECNPIVTGCVFIGNQADGDGGGMLNQEARPTVVSCLFSENTCGGFGGAIHSADGGTPTLINCVFRGNTAKYGGAISTGYETFLEVFNCTFSGNGALFGRTLACDREYGGPSTVRIVNGILWNGGNEVFNNDGSSISISYSNVQGGYDGQGNIDAHPRFRDPDGGDFYLSPSSPCIDAGDSDAVPPHISTDHAAMRRFLDDPDTENTGRGWWPVVDMGAHEFMPDAGCSNGVCEEDEDCASCPFDCCRSDGTIEVPGNLPSIRLALHAAESGDDIIVAPGRYREALNFLGKAVRLEGSGGPEVTTIDASGLNASVVSCTSDEGPDTVIQGFTLTGGTPRSDSGGGMNNDRSSPTVVHCIFRENFVGYGGGGMCNRDSASTVIDCVFVDNISDSIGGGMYNIDSSPTIINSAFFDNAASSGGGLYNSADSHPLVANCVFSGNSAVRTGGGMYNFHDTDPRITNCTIVGNTAEQRGGGLSSFGTQATVANSIVWANSPDQIYAGPDEDVTVRYSDVEGGYPGEGNIDVDPLFVEPELRNFRLALGSPCIDAADNTAVPRDDLDLDEDGDTEEPLPFDLDARPRFVDHAETDDTGRCGEPCVLPIVDMGAYELDTRRGACCITEIGDCTDDVPYAECIDHGGRFETDVRCVDLDPPCGATPCTRNPPWQCDGDVDGDGQVNPVDSGLVQSEFCTAESCDGDALCQYDLDCDGQINPVDSGIVQSLFGTCETPRTVCP